MKKWICKAMIVVLVLLQAGPAWANAGPTFWEAYPASDVLSVDETTSIRIEGETLEFDFSGRSGSVGEDFSGGWTLGGWVTATYDMHNPTEQGESVYMAFPFVGRASMLPYLDVAIDADGQPVPFELYAGDVAPSFLGGAEVTPGEEGLAGAFVFEDILEGITKQSYVPEYFAKNEQGTLHTISIVPEGEQELHYELSCSYDPEKTRMLFRGFSGFTRDGEGVRNSTWCYGETTLEVFVLGEDVAFEEVMSLDYEGAERTEEYEKTVAKSTMSVYDYLVRHIGTEPRLGMEQAPEGRGLALSDEQLYNVFAKELDKSFEINTGFASDHFLSDVWHVERMITLLYRVSFPAGSDRRVRVRYKAYATMDMRQTSNPMYTMTYLLSPAGRWAGFKDLAITVLPPEEAPFVIRSSVPLERQGDGTYAAMLSELPDGELTFTMYEQDKVTAFDELKGKLFRELGYMYPVVLGIGAVLIGFVLLVVWIVRRRLKRR